MKVYAVITWHPFGFPRAFAGFADTDGRIYLVLDPPQRWDLARDIPSAQNWIARQVNGRDKRGGAILGRIESYGSGEPLAVAFGPDEIGVSPFTGEGDSLAPRKGLTWGTAMLVDAARKVAAAAKVALGPPAEECWARR